MTTTRLTIGLAAVVLAVAVAAGCGGGSGSGSSSAAAGGGSASGGTVVEIDVADSGFAFVKTTATAPAGVVTLKAKNPQSTDHNISIKSADGSINEDGQNVKDGGVSEVTVTLKPGTYTYFCSVPGHEEAGMKGTLTVT